MAEIMNYLRPRQAAQRLNVSDQYLSDLLVAGKLRYILTPLGRIVDADDVERLRAERLQRRGHSESAES